MALLVPFLMIAVFAVMVGLIVFVVTQTARPPAISTPPAPPAALVARELSRLDQLLATDRLSRAEYQARRNQLLGLPCPPAR